MSRSETTIALVVAGCLAFVAGCGSDDDESTTPAPATTGAPGATEPPETTAAPATTAVPATTAAPVTSVAPPTTQAPETTAPPPTSAPAEECRLLEGDFQPVVPGEYCVETIGAPFTISVPTGWWVQPNSNAFTVLTDANSQGPGDREIKFTRASNLSDPDKPNAPLQEQRGDWPLDDIEGWLEALIPGVLAGEPVADSLGGFDAIRFDVLLSDEVECGDAFCVGFTTNRAVNGTAFDRRIGYRVWWIDGGDEAPVAVLIGDGGVPEFVPRAEEMLETLVFESIGPNPLATDGPPWESGIPSDVPAGEVTLPLGPGVTFVTTTGYFINQDDQRLGIWAGIQSGDNWQMDIYFPSVDVNGEPVDSVDDVIAGLEGIDGAEVEVVGTRTIDGREATEVRFTTPEFDPGAMPVFPVADDPESGYRPPPDGRMWIVELDDGIAFITAEGYGPGGLEAATEAVQEILDTIMFGS